jgi:basic amino acid/polyamine antiporter, APA family
VTSNSEHDAARKLKPELGVFGATMMGLGSIIGTGVFVSIGIAAGIAGPAIIVSTLIAAMVATCNALNSAQLAANHPVSGGTYEYGYKYLQPWLGFTAGWTFLCAKLASAATAALGFAGYLLYASGNSQKELITPVAVGTILVLTLVVLNGIQRSSRVNIAIVTITVSTLVLFCLAGIPAVIANSSQTLTPFFKTSSAGPIPSILHATALIFVAFTGYGRIATLGEEVREPQRTIPRAIIVTLVISAVLYVAVGIVSIAVVGADELFEATKKQAAPLEIVARSFSVKHIHLVVAVGAMMAMLGVLLNLILGLSRVLLAMGRRGDMPSILSKINSERTTPTVAVMVVGSLIAILAFIGDVKTTWSFSAFTVLIYYAITNLAALKLPAEQRLYSPFFSWGGLAACLFLAFWVEKEIWLAGLGLIMIGLLWHFIATRLLRKSS